MALLHSFITAEPDWNSISNTVQRFHPRFWTLQSNARMFGTLISGTNSLKAYLLAHASDDFPAIIWRTEDIWEEYDEAQEQYLKKTINHPKFRYYPNSDYTNCVLSFHWKGLDTAKFNGANWQSPILTVEYGTTPATYAFFCLKDAASNISMDGTEADISITFDSSHFKNVDGVPIATSNIVSLKIGLAPITAISDYNKNYTVELTNITCNQTLKRSNDYSVAHSLKMTDGFDDSYFLTPEQIVESIYELGYRDWYNLYIGMSHFYNLRYDTGLAKYKVDLTADALNIPTTAWLTDLCTRLHAKGFKFIGSVSMELLNTIGGENWQQVCPSGWEQVDWNGNVAQTGWNPASTLLDPNGYTTWGFTTYYVKDYLAKIGIEVMDCVAAGAEKYYQIGEAWWWWDSVFYIYNTITKALFTSENSGKAPQNVSPSASWGSLTSDQQLYITWCSDKLAELTHFLKTSIKAAHATAKVTQLIFSPSVIYPAVAEVVSQLNTNEQWKYPEYDLIQMEDYDWIYTWFGTRHSHTEYLGDADNLTPPQNLSWDYAIDTLGYSADKIHYFSGFQFLEADETVPNIWGEGGEAYIADDKYKIIGQIRHAIETKNATGFVWARPQVYRDGYLFTGTAGAVTPPTLIPDSTDNTVDNNIDITFADDETWRLAITAVKVNGSLLTVTTDYVITAGQLRLKPSGLNPLLTVSGTKTVTVEATEYNDASCEQEILPGVATQLGMKTQPTSPSNNGGVLGTQPAVYIKDQYGNVTTSTANVTASVEDGTWTLGGTTTKAGVAGTATFTNLTATAG